MQPYGYVSQAAKEPRSNRQYHPKTIKRCTVDSKILETIVQFIVIMFGSAPKDTYANWRRYSLQVSSQGQVLSKVDTCQSHQTISPFPFPLSHLTFRFSNFLHIPCSIFHFRQIIYL